MKRTQNAQVLAALRRRGALGLTPIEALAEIGTMRLGARIYDLRQQGHRIESELVGVGTATVARYTLAPDGTLGL